MCGPQKRGRESEETGTESEMTDGTEETITDLGEAPAKRTPRGVPRKPRIPRKKPPPAIKVRQHGSGAEVTEV